MERKSKLSIQLFITTFIVMTVIIAVIMLLQYLFFDVLYENYKTNKVTRKIDDLALMIENDELDLVGLKNIEEDFMFYHNTFVAVVDENNNDYSRQLMNRQNWYTIDAVSEDIGQISFTTNEYEINSYIMGGFIEDKNVGDIFYVGDEYYILFDYIDDIRAQVFLVTDFQDVIIEGYEPVNITEISITNIDTATDDEINEYLFYNYYITQGIVEDNIFADTAVAYSAENIVELQKTIPNSKGENITIRAVISLENVDDAAAALLSYYPYFLALGVVCAFIVSLIYSKKVSKPIVNISRISNDIANLNFSSKVKSSSNNEIGTLGDNLNTLADNLQNALEELKDANIQLLKDIEQKKEQEKARKAFVANVSHELKTPLGVIRCYAESLKDGMTTKPESEYYDDILQETSKMTRLVMEMLELSKVESGDLKLHKTVFNMKDIVDDNIILHQVPAKEKRIDVVVEGVFPPVCADADKIDSAVSNILNNGIIYGEKSSQVKIKGEMKNDKICRLSVSNKCEGISQHDAEKFFDRFYVGDKSRHQGSTGLGLAIYAGIMKAHDFDYGIISDEKEIIIWFEYVINEV